MKLHLVVRRYHSSVDSWSEDYKVICKRRKPTVTKGTGAIRSWRQDKSG